MSPDGESFAPMSGHPLYAQNKTLEAYQPGRAQSTNSFKGKSNLIGPQRVLQMSGSFTKNVRNSFEGAPRP